MSRNGLSTYLTDHLAGATAGVSLAWRCAKHHEGTPAGRRLDQVAHEIEDDRTTLVAFMSELGIRPSSSKNAAAWITERLSRLKPSGRLRGETAYMRMHELEALSLGITGKQAMWRALRVAPESVAIANLDLDALHERARSQRERVEIERIAVARVALSLSPEAASQPADEANATLARR
jgi:hypothetical protein